MSSFTLKLIAILSMTIDHIGFILFPEISLLRNIGRIAFPIFAYQLGIGFEKTKSKEKYIIRMLIFAILSQIPFHLAYITGIPNSNEVVLNIGVTLTCGLLALYSIKQFDKLWLKALFSFLILILAAIIPMDYGWYGVLTIILFYLFRKDKLFTFVSYFMLLTVYCSYKESTFNLPAIFALIPILLYNGKKGPNAKYLFYIFYPLHLLILVCIDKFLLSM